MLKIVLLMLAVLVPASSSPAEAGHVTAEGVAAIEGPLPAARAAAVEDAQLNAVEQAVGILIGPQKQVEHYQAIRDTILLRAKGYVKHWQSVNERTDSGLLRVTLDAEIDMDKLANDLSAMGLRGKEKTGTRAVTILLTGITRQQLASFKEVLMKQVRGAANVDERSYSGNVAKVRVDTSNSVQALSDELTSRDFGGFSIEVTGSTSGSLELRVVQKTK